MKSYSPKAQPYLDVIADGFFTSKTIQKWLISETAVEHDYADAVPLEAEQREVRWAKKVTKQPFWANYFCGKDSKCTCRIEGSNSLEPDAIFFLKNNKQRTLAIHVEFKHPTEKLSFGQPEAYPLRAECFSKTHNQRETINAHEDWITILVCGDEALSDDRLKYFQKIITFIEAEKHLINWPQ